MLSFPAFQQHQEKIAIIGLGYVGLPLAVHLADYFAVIGFDISAARVAELKRGHDRTREVEDERLCQARIQYTSDPADMAACHLFIVAVPTPIDEYRIPDLRPLVSASTSVGQVMGPGSCVVYESTVYPGLTEEVCLPILEKESGLKMGVDFTLGYSPERVNPGDKKHTIDQIAKVVSGSDPATTDFLAQIYGQVVKVGIHKAPSIKVAEAAKVIENTQRDLNIALMNELALIFDHMGIDTLAVLEAAATKWNFLPFRPGLVGGHCIGVDPYYLTFKAQSLGYHPAMILAGRRINDGMAKFVAEKTVKLLIHAGKQVRGAKVAVLGITFKENVPDLRNTKVADIITELQDYQVQVIVHDPIADVAEAQAHYGVALQPLESIHGADAIILAVAHQEYQTLGLAGLRTLGNGTDPVLIDVKALFTSEAAAAHGFSYWRL